MTAERLARLLGKLPPDALLPAGWVLEQLEGAPADDDDPVMDLSVEQAAEALAKAPSTIRGYCSGGLLPGAYKVGRSWRIPRASLRRYGEKSPEGELAATLGRSQRVNLSSWRQLRRSGEGDGED